MNRRTLIIAGWLFLGGCGWRPQSPPGSQESGGQQALQPVRIVCTTGMIADLVRNLVGDRPEVTVTALMGAGVDPHLFKPTRGDVRQLQQADIIFYNGLHLEGRMDDVFASLKKAGKNVCAVTDSLGDAVLKDDAGHSPDPHVWMDAALWQRCAKRVADYLGEVDSAHAAEYEDHYFQYVLELRELDEYIRRCVQSIPADQRVLVTAHDAFRYFSRGYGMEVKSVQGITTDAEAGVNDVNALVELLVQRKIPTLFVETSVNPKNLQAVLEGVRSRGGNCVQGPELYSDAFGTEGTYEGTYIGMLDANTTRITRALQGTAPITGFRGKLPE